MTTALSWFLLGLVLSTKRSNADPVRCQHDDSSSILGYNNLGDLNEDIQREVDRIASGGQASPSYEFVLCPNTLFDPSSAQLLPKLSNSTFVCGSSGSRSDNCIFLGGSEQIVIEDSDIDGYPLQALSFLGITFTQFEGNSASTGSSVTVRSTDSTEIEFLDCLWSTYNNANFVIRIAPASNSDTRVSIVDSTVQNGSSGVVFDNDRGTFFIRNSLVSGVTASTLSAVANGGETSLRDSVLSGSSLNTVAFSTGGGSHEISSVSIENMNELDRAFQIEGLGSTLTLSQSLVRFNVQDSAWTLVNVATGGTASIDQTRFDGNSGLSSGIRVVNPGSSVDIQRSFFVNNTGRDSSGATSSMLFGFQDAIFNVRSTEFEANTDFTGEVLLFSRSSISIQRSCFQNSAADFLVYSDRLSSASVSENFVGDYETPPNRCPTNPLRLFQERPSDGCFIGGSCEGQCLLLSEENTCLAQVLEIPTGTPSQAPSIPEVSTPMPSLSPSRAEIPTAMPSLSPSRPEIPTAIPSLAPSPPEIPTAMPSQAIISPSASPDPTDGTITASPTSPISVPSISPTRSPPVSTSPPTNASTIVSAEPTFRGTTATPRPTMSPTPAPTNSPTRAPKRNIPICSDGSPAVLVKVSELSSKSSKSSKKSSSKSKSSKKRLLGQRGGEFLDVAAYRSNNLGSGMHIDYSYRDKALVGSDVTSVAYQIQKDPPSGGDYDGSQYVYTCKKGKNSKSRRNLRRSGSLPVE